MRRVAAAVACVLVFAFSAVAAPVEPHGYRNEDYRTLTPKTLAGATVLTTPAAHELWLDRRAVFVDAMPQAPRPKNLPKDVVWRDPPRNDIPGSLWLPDTGYGELAPVMQDYFVAGLRKAQDGDANRTLVFYCKRDCWMSWNAAKRALALGFHPVDWYPDGVDGWEQAGYPLEARTPEPRP